jgi:predicted ATPase
LVHHLVAVASTAPLLLVFEDVHWADQNSLEFVNLLLAAIPDYPVLLVVTGRSDFGNRWTHLPHLTSLQLTPLSKADTAEMIRVVSPKRHLTAPARSAILVQRRIRPIHQPLAGSARPASIPGYREHDDDESSERASALAISR